MGRRNDLLKAFVSAFSILLWMSAPCCGKSLESVGEDSRTTFDIDSPPSSYPDYTLDNAIIAQRQQQTSDFENEYEQQPQFQQESWLENPAAALGPIMPQSPDRISPSHFSPNLRYPHRFSPFFPPLVTALYGNGGVNPSKIHHDDHKRRNEKGGGLLVGVGGSGSSDHIPPTSSSTTSMLRLKPVNYNYGHLKNFAMSMGDLGGNRGRLSAAFLPRKRQILFRQCFFNPISCF